MIYSDRRMRSILDGASSHAERAEEAVSDGDLDEARFELNELQQRLDILEDGFDEVLDE